MRSKWNNWDTLILLGLFLAFMGIVFIVSDGGLVFGIIMLIAGISLVIGRIIFKFATTDENTQKDKPKKWNKKYDNGLYGGLLLLLIGFLMLIAELSVAFSIILMLIGGILTFVTLISAFLAEPQEQTKYTPKKENVFNFIFNQSLEEYMKTFREIAEDMGKIDNYHKHYDSLKEKTRLLQSQYGYALQDLPNRPVITTSLCLYYILDADGYIYTHTKQPTTEEQFIDIVQAIIDNCNDDLLDENPDMFIMGIVANYFSPLLIADEDE